MDPLAAYLLSVMKRERTTDSRTFMDSRDALSEMGYWCLERPVGYTRQMMPPCRISTECRLVEEFQSYTPPFAGVGGFGMMVEVYADPRVIE